MMIYLDTHVLVWLYTGLIQKIPPKTQLLIEKNALLASPISILELEYLFEIKRITVRSENIIDDLKARIGLLIDDNLFSSIINKSLTLSWTRDPFDRVIAASAEMRDIPLLTKDQTIRKHCSLATW